MRENVLDRAQRAPVGGGRGGGADLSETEARGAPVGRGQAEHAAQQALGRTPLQGHAAAVGQHESHAVTARPFGLGRLAGVALGISLGQGGAGEGDGAALTQRRLGPADGGAEVHQRLGPVAGPLGPDQLCRERLQFRL